MSLGPLVDRFGRVHADLRVSVTDRCNLRCTYCMPAEVVFRPREELLTYEEIARVVAVAAQAGIRSVRLTGGEPLVRRDVPVLVRQLVAIDGIEEVALTTNGLLLAEQAALLFAAGLTRLNVSLDSLREDVFERIARRQGLDRVLAGLAAARRAGRAALRGRARPAQRQPRQPAGGCLRADRPPAGARGRARGPRRRPPRRLCRVPHPHQCRLDP
jgi:cyclic pyranopterin phosphate synthase